MSQLCVLHPQFLRAFLQINCSSIGFAGRVIMAVDDALLALQHGC